jgi:acetyltransferase-like isoleucine patch superfamily enzyme
MDLGKGVRIAQKAHLDKNINPKGIHIGNRTWVLNGAFVMAHDHCRGIITDTYIGHDCVIGVNSIIMPGVKIGNEVVIGSASIVTKDIPDNCIAVGNPAKVIKTNIKVHNGKIQDV